MAVNETYSVLEFPGDGTTAPRVITWQFISPSHLVVVEIDDASGSQAARSLGVHYTVTQTATGGTITPVSAIASGKTWRVSRATPRTQPDVLRVAGGFSEATVERMHDRAVLQLQEVDARVGAGDPTLRADLASGDIGRGAALVAYQQPLTGAVARDLDDKVAESISVEDFGAVGDGVADDTLAIQRAENALAAAGGGELLFRSTRYKVTATLTKRASNVLWRGRGEGHQHDAGSGIDCASALIWGGEEGETMIDFAPAAGASNRRISGGGIVGIGLYGGEVAARGLDMRSVNNAKIDIYADGFTDDCMYMGVVATLGEARDTQQNDVRLLFQQVGANSGRALVLDGDTTANTSCNKIHLRGAYKFATALQMVNCDNNLIYCWVFRFGGGTALGVDILGGASAAVAARANTFEYMFAGDGGVRLRGTGDGYTVAATRTRFLMWDNDNVQPLPIVGTGCDYFLVDHDGTVRWTEMYAQRVAANVLDWKGRSDKIMLRLQWTSDTADSYWEMRNTTPGAVQLQASSDSAANVNINILTKGAGIGALYGGNFASVAFQWRHNGGAQLGFFGTTPISKPTVTGSRGGNAALASALTALANLGLITNSSTA